MIEVVAIKIEHMTELLKREAVAYVRPLFTPEVLKNIERNPHTAAILMDGKVVFAGGVSQYWPQRGEAWAFFDDSCRKNFIPIVRAARKWLDACPVSRIEAAVDIDATQAHRWVKLLGFELEAPRLRKYRPDGKDCALYARVK